METGFHDTPPEPRDEESTAILDLLKSRIQELTFRSIEDVLLRYARTDSNETTNECSGRRKEV